MTIRGIDVSSYQPTTYATAGMDFVIVKATEGTGYVNPRMAAQAQRARDASLVVGFYHFLHPGDVDAQAKYFVERCASRTGDILACDWEATSSGNASCSEKDQFIRAVKRLRPDHRVILYCSTDWWLHRDTTGYTGDGLWVAQYNNRPGQPSITAPWLFHQYTSSPIDTSIGQFPSRAALKTWAAISTQEDDPMAGMTKKDIADAVWRTDDIAAGSTEKNKGNTTWVGETYLKGTFENTVKLLAQETAQTAAITKLAGLVGSGVDTATVVAEVKAAIADAVVKVSVDVTGADSA